MVFRSTCKCITILSHNKTYHGHEHTTVTTVLLSSLKQEQKQRRDVTLQFGGIPGYILLLCLQSKVGAKEDKIHRHTTETTIFILFINTLHNLILVSKKTSILTLPMVGDSMRNLCPISAEMKSLNTRGSGRERNTQLNGSQMLLMC